jgi:hypothetical protein
MDAVTGISVRVLHMRICELNPFNLVYTHAIVVNVCG